MAENFFGITDTGKIRDNNEDAFIVQTTKNNQFIIACVIDGVGGYEGGEVAAAIARESILHSFKNISGDIITTMRSAFADANDKIYKEKSGTGKNASMACVLTLAIVDIKNNKFYYAHVGDTRLYLFRDQSLVKVTKDQSFVGFLEDSGRLSEDEAMNHPKRNEINKALGFDQQAVLTNDYVETGESPFLPGDTILLCSDGLTDLVNANNISSILLKKTTLEAKGKELIVAANNAGGKDNITVVLVQNNKRPVKQETKKPVLVKKNNSEKVEHPPSPQVAIPRTLPPLRKKINGSRNVVYILSGFCVLLLIGLIWLWTKQDKNSSAQTITRQEKNAPEIRLQSYINSGLSDTVLLTDSGLGSTIYLTDTIWVRRDSLYLKGSGGAGLVRHSSFENGPAIMITPQCRSIILDSMTLQDFPVGIVTSNPDALQLKNTRFRNCPVAVAYKFVPDSVYINGGFVNQKQNESHR